MSQFKKMVEKSEDNDQVALELAVKSDEGETGGDLTIGDVDDNEEDCLRVKSAKQDLLDLAGLRLSLVSAKGEAYNGSISEIYNETNKLVKLCLGPGRSLQFFLFGSILIDAISHIVVALTIAAVTLMYFGEIETNATPKQVSTTLFIVALLLTACILAKHFMMNHAGTYFMKRAKFAIKKSNIEYSTAEEANLMSHLSRVRTLFLTDKVVVISAMVTEIMSMIFIVICSNLVVAAVAGLLLIVVKYLSSVDDYLLIQEQHKKVALIEKLEDERQAASLAESSEASSALQADLRFFHNSTSPGHVIIKMAHVTFCYVSPVFFFYFVFSCGALPSNHHNYLQTSEIVCSIVLFCLISSLQIKEHGRVIHLINNIFHCEKVIIFDKQFDVFSCLLDSPDSIKEAKQVRWAWSGRL